MTDTSQRKGIEKSTKPVSGGAEYAPFPAQISRNTIGVKETHHDGYISTQQRHRKADTAAPQEKQEAKEAS